MKFVTREDMKEEALSRMTLFRLMPAPIRDFKDFDLVNLSENGGMLYWLDDEQKEMVRNFEERSGALVYHVVRNFTNMGQMYTLLYVSKYKEEWKQDREDVKDGFPLCYVVNVDNPEFSEYGSCSITPCNGGLRRTF